MDWVTAVWRYMPTTLQLPTNVTQDGKGGVTQATFDNLLELVQDRVGDRMVLHNLEAPDWNFLTNPDPSLESAVAQLVAAYILRKFPAFETLYKDYFANGFSTLDEYIESERAKLGEGFNTPEFVDEDVEFKYGFPSVL